MSQQLSAITPSISSIERFDMGLTISPLRFPSLQGEYRFISREDADGLLLRIEKIKSPFSWETKVNDLSQYGQVNLPQETVFEGLKEALLQQAKEISESNTSQKLLPTTAATNFSSFSSCSSVYEVVASTDLTVLHSLPVLSVDVSLGEFDTLVMVLNIPVVRSVVQYCFCLQPIVSDSLSIIEAALHDIDEDNKIISQNVIKFKQQFDEDHHQLKSEMTSLKRETYEEVQLLKAEIFSLKRQLQENFQMLQSEMELKYEKAQRLVTLRLKSSPNICPIKLKERDYGEYYAIPWEEIEVQSDPNIFQLSSDRTTIQIKSKGWFQITCFADNVLDGYYHRDNAVMDVANGSILGGDSVYFCVEQELNIAIVNINCGDTYGMESIGSFPYLLTIIQMK